MIKHITQFFYLRKSQMSLFDYQPPRHEEVKTVHAGTRHLASGAVVQVAEHQRKVQVRGKEGSEPKHGEKIYYRTPEMNRKKRGHIVGGSHETGYEVKPVREGYALNPPHIKDIGRDHIWTEEEHTAEKAPKGTGGRVTAEESTRRALVGMERIGMPEAEILQHPAIVDRMKGTLKHLASRNGYNPNYVVANGVLHNDDPAANELYSEYITAAIGALRTSGTNASDADIQEFKDYLAGTASESNVAKTIARTGKTAAMRHLIANNDRLKEEQSYDTQGEDDYETGMRDIAAKAAVGPADESNAAKQEGLANGIAEQLDALDDPIASAIIKMKFGLGRFDHGYKEQDIAAALNRTGVRSEAVDRWDAAAVKSHMQTALVRLARTKGAKELLGFLKSLREETTLRKSASVHQKTICVDFDGVIADYSQGWQGAETFGEPLPQVSAVMLALKQAGWKIIIFTTRQETPALRGYLGFNDIPYDEINKNSDQPENSNDGKPIADVYLDDRAIRFTDWEQALVDIDIFTKSLRADNLMDRSMLIKSHVKQYTRQDGSVVQEHDDKRVKKHQDVLKHQNEHGEEVHSGAKLKHGDQLAEHLKSRGWKEREAHQVKPIEGHKGGKKDDMPEHEEIKAKNRENGALQTAERGMKKMREAAAASDDPVSVLKNINTSRSNTYTAAIDDYREKLLKHYGHQVDRDSTATKYEKDGHAIIMSKDGDGHTVHFAGGDPTKDKEQISSLQGKKEVQSVDTGKKEPKFVMGKENKAYTAKMNEVSSKYALVESDDLTTSHTIQGHINKAYPQEIQPRERERLSSQMQMANMMNDIKPELFGAGSMAAHGAPIVGKDGAVESGNGRTIALTEAYKRGLADHYKEWLKGEADTFGIKPEDVEKMKNPVLVRVRSDDDKNTDRAEFAREANDTGNLGSSPAEQAWNDSARIDDSLLKKFTVDEDGEIYNEDNMDFINRFLDKLGKNESAGLRDADGDPNKKCIERIQNAVFTKVYGSSMLTELQAESAKPKIRNVLKALNGCVADFAQIKGHDDLDVVPDMMEAIEYTLAHQNQSKAELEHTLKNAGSLDFTGDTPKFKTDHSIDMILAISDRAGSRNRLENVFRAISNGIKNEVASRENPEVDMFSGPAEPKNKEQVVKQALDKVNSSDDGVKKSLQRPALTHLIKSHGGTDGRIKRRGKVQEEVGTLEKSACGCGHHGRCGQEESCSCKAQKEATKDQAGTDGQGQVGSRTAAVRILKSHVAAYDRTTTSGALAHIDAHEDSRVRRYAIKLARTENSHQLHKLRQERFGHLPHWGALDDHTKQRILDAEDEVHGAHAHWEKWKEENMPAKENKEPMADHLPGDRSGLMQARLFKARRRTMYLIKSKRPIGEGNANAVQGPVKKSCALSVAHILRKSQHPDHAAYTRTTASGATANVAQKGQLHHEMVKELHDAFERHDKKGRGGMGISADHPDYSTPEKYAKTAKNILKYKGHERLGKQGSAEVGAMLERHIKQLEA